uniref:hypothetical protein n=1 Tax=Algoriphagus sp. TaxID=1872435 RepID=UPI004048678A
MSDDTPLPVSPDSSLHGSVPVTGMYKDWFLDYASYVILERAVPAIEDGLNNVSYFYKRGIRYITLTHGKDNLI